MKNYIKESEKYLLSGELEYEVFDVNSEPIIDLDDTLINLLKEMRYGSIRSDLLRNGLTDLNMKERYPLIGFILDCSLPSFVCVSFNSPEFKRSLNVYEKLNYMKLIDIDEDSLLIVLNARKLGLCPESIVNEIAIQDYFK